MLFVKDESWHLNKAGCSDFKTGVPTGFFFCYSDKFLHLQRQNYHRLSVINFFFERDERATV